MKALALLVGAGVLLAGGIAFAATRDDEDDNGNPLGQPNATGDCTSASDVWQVTQDFLADPASDAQTLRDVAGGYDVLGDYCNEEARQMGKACALALRARADVLDKASQGGPPAPPPSAGIELPPAPFEIPGGTFYQGYGWCPAGAVLDMKTGRCSFQQVVIVPANVLTSTITTSGPCCASCARGDECEEGCH